MSNMNINKDVIINLKKKRSLLLSKEREGNERKRIISKRERDYIGNIDQIFYKKR